MADFKYIATSPDKNTKEGTVTAADRSAAILALTKQDLRPISIREVTSKDGGSVNLKRLFTRNSVRSNDLVIFTRQLSTMISAGVPLLTSLTSLSRHSESPALKKILNTVIADVEAGASFAESLEKHPSVFNSVYVNMVRAGESAGILDDILSRLALQQEKSATIRKKVKSAMAYPTVLISITVIAFFGLMIFIVPQIGKILKDLGGADAQLPPLTQFMLALSGFLINFWWLWLPTLTVSIFLAIRYLKTPKGRAMFHKIVLRIPGVKTIIMKLAVARFSRTFSALIGAGVAVLEALTVTSRAVGNVVYEQALVDAAQKVKEGKQLSAVIEAYNELFPAIVAQMLAVGEETGQTDVVLVKVADFYEEEVDVAIDGLSAIIEPLMIVVMGGMVGLIAASVMGPIASLSQNIQ